jgi:hypothetical protein
MLLRAASHEHGQPDYLQVQTMHRAVSARETLFDVGDMVKLVHRGSLLTCCLQQHARLGAGQVKHRDYIRCVFNTRLCENTSELPLR